MTTLSIKKLYTLNNQELNFLRTKLNNDRINIYNTNSLDDCISFMNIQKNNITNLMREQSILKQKIPENKQYKVNIVSNFCIDVFNDLNTFKEEIMNNNSADNTSYNTTNNSSNYNSANNTSNYNTANNTNYNIANNTNNTNNTNYNPANNNNNTKYNFNKSIGVERDIETNMRSTKFDSENLNNSIDPYKLYGFDKNSPFTEKELKDKFRKYALQTHPDKNNGDTRNFNIVKNAFKQLYDDLKLKEKDKQFLDLKNNSRHFIQTQTSQSQRDMRIDSKSFDINRFNQVYQDNRIDSVADSGYKDWIKDNSFDSEDIEQNSKLGGGFNINNFNDVFNSDVKQSNEVIKYSKPKNLFMNQENNCVTLGEDKIDNYSGETKNIKYTDYKEAHTTNKLVDPNTTYRKYKNIDDIKHARSNIKELTTEEIMELEIEKKNEEELERKREENLRLLDELHYRNYNKVNKIMLSR